MKKTRFIFLAGLSLIFFLSIFTNYYFLPIDIVGNLPLFRQGEWQRPQNSLIADPVFQFEPWRMFVKEKFSKGEFPLWNNLNGMGSPFFANPQTSVLYPIQFFYYFLPTKQALFIVPLLKLYFYFWFVYLYLRSLNCLRSISLFGASVSVFSGFVIVWLLWPQTNVLIFLPLLLYFIEKIKTEKQKKSLYFLLTSITYCIAIFGGHPETLILVFLTHLTYSLLRFRLVKSIKYTITPLFVGLILSAVQLIPFIEYLLYSNSFNTRGMGDFLPIKSFIINFIPFIFGAPHQQFYKPIFGVNFQEAIGGYFGASILILALYGILRFFKNILFKAWGIIVFLSFTIAYKIWPFWLITFIPILNKNANARFSAVGGFGIVVLSSLTLQELLKRKTKIKTKQYIFLSLISIALLLISVLMLSLISNSQSDQIISFSKFLQFHLTQIIISSWVFFILLFILLNNKLKNFILLLLIPLFFQTGLLFLNYNTVNSYYYPQNQFVNKLKKLPKGAVLEVGNPSLPENINILYDIPHAQNYDALEVGWYKNKFDSLFPVKNQWGNPNEVKLENLQKLGISYVISDYDLNLNKIPYQTKIEKILPLNKDKVYSLRLKPQTTSLKQIRILTANFNRKNTCSARIELRSNEDKFVKSFPCSMVNDFMYFTFDINKQLDITKEYELLFSSEESSNINNIGLWGNLKNVPYLELLYDKPSLEKSYIYLFQEKNFFLFKIPDVSFINMKGSYKNLLINSESISFETETQKPEKIVINQTFYPGWRGRIDGLPVEIKNENPFISLNVPEGRHLVSISYKPDSFYLGLAVSAVGWLGVFIYLTRTIINSSRAKFFNKTWNKWAVRINKRISFLQHFVIFSLGTICSLIIISIASKTAIFHFQAPKTSAINWLTINNYPKQQDYILIFFGTLFIVVCSFFIWLIWILRKKL